MCKVCEIVEKTLNEAKELRSQIYPDVYIIMHRDKDFDTTEILIIDDSKKDTLQFYFTTYVPGMNHRPFLFASEFYAEMFKGTLMSKMIGNYKTMEIVPYYKFLDSYISKLSDEIEDHINHVHA